MQMKKVFLLALLMFLIAGTPNPADAATVTPKLEVSGWIPYWRAATGTIEATNHLDQLTEINPFGYSVKSDGTLADTANLDEEPWTSLIAAARQKKVRVIPT